MAQDTTQPLPSQNEVFIDRYRRITPKWYPFIKRLFDSLRTTIRTVNSVEAAVGTLDTQVTEVIQIVDNVKLQWGILLNANGFVTGRVRLDGTPGSSTFDVLADNVRFYHQSAPGTFVVPFQSTITSGQPTITMNANVRINGNAVISGSLSSNAFAATEIFTNRIRSPDGRLDINPSAATPYIRLTS